MIENNQMTKRIVSLKYMDQNERNLGEYKHGLESRWAFERDSEGRG